MNSLTPKGQVTPSPNLALNATLQLHFKYDAHSKRKLCIPMCGFGVLCQPCSWRHLTDIFASRSFWFLWEWKWFSLITIFGAPFSSMIFQYSMCFVICMWLSNFHKICVVFILGGMQKWSLNIQRLLHATFCQQG